MKIDARLANAILDSLKEHNAALQAKSATLQVEANTVMRTRMALEHQINLLQQAMIDTAPAEGTEVPPLKMVDGGPK